MLHSDTFSLSNWPRNCRSLKKSQFFYPEAHNREAWSFGGKKQPRGRGNYFRKIYVKTQLHSCSTIVCNCSITQRTTEEKHIFYIATVLHSSCDMPMLAPICWLPGHHTIFTACQLFATHHAHSCLWVIELHIHKRFVPPAP